MLVIRDEQLAVFRNAALEGFSERLIPRLRSSLPSRSEADLRAEIFKGARYALQFGIVSERDLARYIEIVVLHMGGFSDKPPKAALNILQAHGAEPRSKLDGLAEWVRAHPRTVAT
jgi:hypothetical protein